MFSRAPRQGFTLIEMLVTLAALGLVGGIAYAVLLDGFNLFVRNISINKSDNGLRYCLQRLKRDVTQAIQAPQLISYDPTRATPIQPVTVANSGLTYAQGVRLVINKGPAYCLTSTASSTPDSDVLNPALAPNTLSFRLWRHVPTTGTGRDPAPLPAVGDRLMFLYPAPAAGTAPVPAGATYPDSTQQILPGNVTRPGRKLTVVGTPAATLNYVDVSVEDLRPAQNLPGIIPFNTAYVVHEVAYAVWTNRDAAGNAVSRELRYFPSADDPTNFAVVSRDLDPNPREQMRDDGGALVLDAGGKPQPVQPFALLAGNRTVLRVNLPVRALDYARAIAERRGATLAVPDVVSEFNVSISAKPTMSNRISL